MKKPSIFSSFTSVLGIFFGIIGISFIIYSLYILFFTPLKEDLINILPSKDFQFILITDNEEKNIPKDIKNKIPFPIPQKGAIVSYNKNKDFISITPELNTKKKMGNKICKTSFHYDFCTSQENSTNLYQLIESIENKKPSLRTLNIFEDNSLFFSDENSYSFAGTTSFLEKNIEKFPLATKKEKKFIKNSLQFSSESLPYFSGNISLEKKKYKISFHKKNETYIFPQSINSQTIPKEYIYPQISSYIYMRKPKFFIHYINENSDEKSLPKTIGIYKKGKTWVSTFFANKTSWEEDIEPMLATDIFFMKSTEGQGIISLLPEKNISNKFYEKFHDILLAISSEKVPEKKGITLNDGTMIYEIFPSKKNVEIITDENKTDDMKFSFFITKKPEEQTKEIAAIAQKNSLIIIADNKKFIENIVRKKRGKQKFTIPLDKEIFFSLGIRNEKNISHSSQEKENISPIEQMEITGKETKKHLIFSGTIEWNNDFFIKNIQDTIESDESNENENEDEDESKNDKNSENNKNEIK